MNKHVPNLITSVRLAAAAAIAGICITHTGEQWFLPLFVAAGISDMLDGITARRFNLCTEFGARLDSISDLSLYIATTTFLCLHAAQFVQACAPFVVLGATMQVLHLIYAYAKMRQFPAYHSTLSRAAAYAIFFSVIAFWIFKLPLILPGVALIWAMCSLEGIVITTILRGPRTNVSGVRAAYLLAKEPA